MKTFMNFSLVLGSYTLRVGSGTVVFILMARLLGPAAFGQFAYWLAWATLLAIPVNFGFNALVLRGFGAEPDRALTLMSEVLLAKLSLAGLPLLFVVLSPIWLTATDAAILALLCLAQVCDSFGEFYLLGFRIGPDYAKEGKAAGINAAVHMAVTGLVIWFWPDPLHAALGFACSRAVGLLLARAQCLACVGRLCRPACATLRRTLRAGWAFALELGLFTVSAQLDSLLISSILGPAALGIYQAGLKLVQALVRMAPVIAQAALPALAQEYGTPGFARKGRRVMLIFAVAGAGLAGLMASMGAALALRLFGNGFASLAPLMPLFGVILFLRIVETGMGLVLVAAGLQHRKVWLVGMQLAAMLLFGWPALQQAGVIGWQWVTIVSLGVLLLLYLRLMLRHHLQATPISLHEGPA